MDTLQTRAIDSAKLDSFDQPVAHDVERVEIDDRGERYAPAIGCLRHKRLSPKGLTHRAVSMGTV